MPLRISIIVFPLVAKRENRLQWNNLSCTQTVNNYFIWFIIFYVSILVDFANSLVEFSCQFLKLSQLYSKIIILKSISKETEFQQRSNIKDINKFFKYRRKYGHVGRMQKNKISRTVRGKSKEGKRSIGRPCKTCPQVAVINNALNVVVKHDEKGEEDDF